MNRHDLEEQLQDLVDGTLDEAELQACLAEIKADPARLELYCQYAELESAFQRMRSSRAALGGEQACVTRDVQRRTQRFNIRLTTLAAVAIIALLAVSLKLILVHDRPPILTFQSTPGSVIDVSHALAGDEPPDPGRLVSGSPFSRSPNRSIAPHAHQPRKAIS